MCGALEPRPSGASQVFANFYVKLLNEFRLERQIDPADGMVHAPCQPPSAERATKASQAQGIGAICR